MEIIALIFLATAGMMWAPVPHFYRLLGERKLRTAAQLNRTICLTFDDGPSENLTRQLISLLERFEAPATFFLQGNKLHQKNTIDALISNGHEIGCHGYNHVNAWYSTPTKSWKDMDQAISKFHDGGLECRLVRPPYGKITCFSILQVMLRKKTFGWWTLDSHDTTENAVAIDSLIDSISRSGGSIVLFHDLDNHRDEKSIEYVLDATRAILEFAREKNYKLQTMGTLMGFDKDDHQK